MPRKRLTAQELGDQALKELARQALEERGKDPSYADRVKSMTIRSWDGFYKDADGNAHHVENNGVSITLSPEWDEGPEWPVVQPAAPTKITPNRPKPVRTDGWKTAVILPDPQIGYRRAGEELEPFHDEAAINVAMDILAAARKEHPIDRVVNLGDFLDLPGQGKFIQEPGFALTTQYAIDYGHQFLARQRAICPEAKISIIEGNHDARLGRQIFTNALSSFGLRRAGDPPTSWPTISVPYLLRVEDLDVEWVEGYPAGGIWLNDHIRCIHGQKVNSRGSTASTLINDSRHSVIFGHVHRLEVQYKTDSAREGDYRKFAATPGCLCRVDGAVPSFNSSVDKTGGSITNYENWQQGLMIVHYRDDDTRCSIEPIEIHNGRAMWRGKEYVSG